MQQTPLSSIPASSLPSLQYVVQLHRAEQVISNKDEFLKIKTSLWEHVNGLMMSVVSIVGSDNETYLNLFKKRDGTIDLHTISDKRTAFAVFKGKDARSRVQDALDSINSFVAVMVGLLGKFDVLSNDIVRYLTDHSNILEYIRPPMAAVVNNPNQARETPNNNAVVGGITSKAASVNLNNNGSSSKSLNLDTSRIASPSDENLAAILEKEIQSTNVRNPPNVGDAYDDFGQNLGKGKRVSKMDNGCHYVKSKTSNTPKSLKSLASSMKKNSSSRSSDRVTFCEKVSKEDDLHTDPKSSKEQAVLKKKRKSKDFDGASEEDDLDKDPTFGLSGDQKVSKKKTERKTKSKDYDLYTDEHFCSMLTMKKRPAGPWRDQLLVHLPGEISSYLLNLAAYPDNNVPMVGSIAKFRTHYRKWISTKDLKDIRESVLGSGVNAEALESQFPCLAVR